MLQILLAMVARASHRSVEADLNDVHMRLQAVESRPDGPAAPSVLSAVLLIRSPSILSNITW